MTDIDKDVYRREIEALVKNVLTELSISQTELSRILGVDPSLITLWLKRERSASDEHRLALQNLLSKPALAHVPASHPSEVPVPILSTIPTDAVVDNTIGRLTMPNWFLGGNWNDCFVLKVHGDQAAPEVRHGDYVLVKPNHPYRPSDCVLVTIDGTYSIEKLENLKARIERKILGVVVWTLRNH